MIKQCILLIAVTNLMYTTAGAQTWRIARASHGGSADEVRSGDDNFGLPYRVHERDTVRSTKRWDTAAKKPVQQMPRKARTRVRHSRITNR